MGIGWAERHLLQFEKNGKIWGVPEHDGFGAAERLDEEKGGGLSMTCRSSCGSWKGAWARVVWPKQRVIS